MVAEVRYRPMLWRSHARQESTALHRIARFVRAQRGLSQLAGIVNDPHDVELPVVLTTFMSVGR